MSEETTTEIPTQSLADAIQYRIEQELLGDRPAPENNPKPADDPSPDAKTEGGGEGKQGEAKEGEKPAEAASLEDLTKLDDDDGEAKADPKKDEDADDDDIPEEVRKQGGKAAAKWGDLKKQARDAERLSSENETLRQRVTELEGKKGGSDEVENLRKALAEKEKVIAAMDVTRSDEYRQAVLEPMATLEDRARALVADAEDEDRLIEALAESNPKIRASKLSEIAENLPDYQRRKLYRIEEDLDALLEKRSGLLRHSTQAKEELDRNRMAERQVQTEQEKAALSDAAEAVWKNITKKLPWLSGEDGKVLAEFAEVEAKGRAGLAPDAPLGTRAFAAYAVELVPKMDAIIRKGQARISELESAVKALKGSSPQMGGGAASDEGRDDEPLADRIMRQAAGAGVFGGRGW